MILGLASLRIMIPLLLFFSIVLLLINGILVIATMPSLFSIILFLVIQPYPPSITKIPSHRPPNISFSNIIVSTLLHPPNAIFAFMFSEILFFSMNPDDVSTSNTPYARFFEITFLNTVIDALLSALTPALLLYPMNELFSILVKFLFPIQFIPFSYQIKYNILNIIINK